MLRATPSREEEQRAAKAAGIEHSPTDAEYAAMCERGSPYRAFLKAFKPDIVQRCTSGKMPASFQVFNIDRMLREDTSLRQGRQIFKSSNSPYLSSETIDQVLSCIKNDDIWSYIWQGIFNEVCSRG